MRTAPSRERDRSTANGKTQQQRERQHETRPAPDRKQTSEATSNRMIITAPAADRSSASATNGSVASDPIGTAVAPVSAQPETPAVPEEPNRGGSRGLASEYYRAGNSLLLAGDLAGAKRKFRAAVSVSRAYAPAYRGLGMAHERSGDRSSAVRAYKQYLRLAPRAGDAETIRKRIAQLGP
jgi:serine/threonine-protein kinase